MVLAGLWIGPPVVGRMLSVPSVLPSGPNVESDRRRALSDPVDRGGSSECGLCVNEMNERRKRLVLPRGSASFLGLDLKAVFRGRGFADGLWQSGATRAMRRSCGRGVRGRKKCGGGSKGQRSFSAR